MGAANPWRVRLTPGGTMHSPKASRAVGDVLREDCTGNSATALNVVTGGPLGRAGLTAYATRLSDLAGDARVEASVATFVHGTARPELRRPGPRASHGAAAVGGERGRSAL